MLRGSYIDVIIIVKLFGEKRCCVFRVFVCSFDLDIVVYKYYFYEDFKVNYILYTICYFLNVEVL